MNICSGTLVGGKAGAKAGVTMFRGTLPKIAKL
jgi:hypothetical protein